MLGACPICDLDAKRSRGTDVSGVRKFGAAETERGCVFGLTMCCFGVSFMSVELIRPIIHGVGEPVLKLPGVKARDLRAPELGADSAL